MTNAVLLNSVPHPRSVLHTHIRSNPTPRRLHLETRLHGSWTIKAQAEDDEEKAFEERLAEIKRAKGEMPYGESRKTSKKKEEGPEEIDYSGETVFYEGSPHTGDLAVNVLLGVTLVWLPLTFAAIGRKAFVKYKFTDKRISVSTTAPWESKQTDVSYNQVREVVAIGRGIGIWGDMVIKLKNGDRIEIRSLDKQKSLNLLRCLF